MTDTRYQQVTFNEDGDLVWSGHDLGPAVSSMVSGANEYEYWRTVRAPFVPALAAALGVAPKDLPAVVRSRFASDVELDAFAEAHGILTEFDNWIPTNWDE